MKIILKVIPIYSLLYIIVICLVWIDYSYGIQIPDIYWDPKEPMFNETLCDDKSKTIHVREDDLLSIICPNRDLNNALVSSTPRGFRHFFNIYVTEDFKLYSERKSKDVDAKATLLHTCREELNANAYGIFKATVNKRFLKFSPFGIGSSGMQFVSGKKYYFYTTADGTEESLKNEMGPQTTRHLAFQVQMCSENQDCPYRWNRCVQKTIQKEKRRDDSGSSNNNTGLQWSYPVIISTILFVLLIGAFIGALVDRWYISRKNNKKSVHIIECGESTSSSAQSSPTCETAVLIGVEKKPAEPVYDPVVSI